MLNFKRFSQIGFIVAAISMVGCKDKDVDPITETTDSTDYQAVNSWIYEVMNDAYFWYKNMPVESSLNNKLNPNEYFEKLIYQRTTTDRFSMITDDIDALTNEFNGVSKIFGINYSLSYTDDSKSNIAAFLSYVVKGSPAEAAGLKRGDIIMKVGGTQLTASNYSTLFGSSETATFTLGTLSGTTLTADNSKTITVTKAEISEDPVPFSTVIFKTAYGKTIGYLVYTQFVPGTTGNAEKYDNELRQVFADFKSKGVNELVLDLRFNPGGYISSAETLASLIGKNVSSSKVFYKEQWNDKYIAYWQSKYGTTALNYNFQDEGNNIGSNLNRVFVLTSNGTASASELVINGLRPYMEVVTIGEHTYGKNLFGSLISDDENRWKWGMYVMLGQTANVNNQSDYGTVNGMAPTYEVEDSVIPYKAFGDENETLLRKALDVIGIPAPTGTRMAATKSVKSFISEPFKDNFIPEKRMIKDAPSLKLIK
ncbi:C-terminal processing protease CtpA/Prc, contains a PDZ domain [Dyadobacter koreensis]|uniref:C-terminal processing protease CtpA/Prc, contains a PDZ domain n=1 Tax=Dyadobacter koreensis TaxID=408657 RepID=A0A1H6YMM5_9BACT|nr:S41 family peptidase [Dyadobacter koreensis]SEJ42531.1 C-terminal processing protease CtpA/Prc, contains a PDZ domain [Dyadobacter koreensis]